MQAGAGGVPVGASAATCCRAAPRASGAWSAAAGLAAMPPRLHAGSSLPACSRVSSPHCLWMHPCAVLRKLRKPAHHGEAIDAKQEVEVSRLVVTCLRAELAAHQGAQREAQPDVGPCGLPAKAGLERGLGNGRGHGVGKVLVQAAQGVAWRRRRRRAEGLAACAPFLQCCPSYCGCPSPASTPSTASLGHG